MRDSQNQRTHSVFAHFCMYTFLLHLCLFASKLAAFLKQNSGAHFLLLFSDFVGRHVHSKSMMILNGCCAKHPN
jgi:hypothetical protein